MTKRWVRVGVSMAACGGLVALGTVLVAQRFARPQEIRVLEIPAAIEQDVGRLEAAPARAVPAVPAGLRQQYGREGRAYSKRVDDLVSSCWKSGNATERYRREPVANVSILIPTTPRGETEFDFCIESLQLDGEPVVWGQDGVVEIEDNGKLGLNGYWFAFSDGHTQWKGEDERPGFAMPVQLGGPICVRGKASRVVDDKYAEIWGAGIGLRLAWREGKTQLYEPRFSVVDVFLSGNSVPARLRLSLDNEARGIGSGQHWCANLDAS